MRPGSRIRRQARAGRCPAAGRSRGRPPSAKRDWPGPGGKGKDGQRPGRGRVPTGHARGSLLVFAPSEATRWPYRTGPVSEAGEPAGPACAAVAAWRSLGLTRTGSGDGPRPVAAWVELTSERSGRTRRVGPRSGGSAAKLGRLERQKRRRAPARGRWSRSLPVSEAGRPAVIGLHNATANGDSRPPGNQRSAQSRHDAQASWIAARQRRYVPDGGMRGTRTWPYRIDTRDNPTMGSRPVTAAGS